MKLKFEEIQMRTEIIALKLLARTHSRESEIASYIFGMTDKMIKDIEKLKSAKHT